MDYQEKKRLEKLERLAAQTGRFMNYVARASLSEPFYIGQSPEAMAAYLEMGGLIGQLEDLGLIDMKTFKLQVLTHPTPPQRAKEQEVMVVDKATFEGKNDGRNQH
jgi:hypothetical protein